jgi:hypothetical protein
MIVSKRTELESTICEVEKGIKEHEVLLKQKEIALKYAQEDMEEKRVDWAHHRTNLTFMKNKATYVDIKEFQGVRELLKRARGEYDEAALKVAGLFTAVMSYRKEVEHAQSEIVRAKTLLDGFGKLLQFGGAT